MFHTFLMLAATEEFRVSFSVCGPTEMRQALIIINGLLVRFGVRPLMDALPYVAVCGTVALALLAYRAQKRLWKSDMHALAASAVGE